MIIIFVGPTASGKSTYKRALIKKYKGVNRIVSYTTRPRRKGEKNKRDYFFIDNETFDDMNESGRFVAVQSFNTLENNRPALWQYGILKEDIAREGIWATTLSPEVLPRALEELKEEEVKVVMLQASEEELHRRAAFRGDDRNEFLRRLREDKKKFDAIHFLVDVFLDTETDEEGMQRHIEVLANVLGVL